MRIRKIKIGNFRLLRNVELVFDDPTTLIVGRNNSGKTSLSEVLNRFLGEGSSTFQLEDFSSSCYDEFCAALDLHNGEADEATIRACIPSIELQLVFSYDSGQDFGPLAPFIVDLDPACTDALAIVRYQLKDGRIKSLFDGAPQDPLNDETRIEFFRMLRERIPAEFNVKIWAQDPNDSGNQRELAPSNLRNLLKTGFINAQRGLDDVTAKESDVLAKILEGLFTTASSPLAGEEDQLIVKALAGAVEDIQKQIDANFGGQLKTLLPTLQIFGYPGLDGQELQTETTLDVKRLMSNFTKVRYAGYGGVALPESYNGLGVRNLIFILFQLVGFYKEFLAQSPAPGVHVIFIEEPEAHLHPQMQEVFIRQLSNVVKVLAKEDASLVWPVQFVVSTHSSHIANEAGFESIRYFLTSSPRSGGVSTARETKIKDLRDGLRDTNEETKKFLHQYLTLTRCDLFFADKAVLVEGLSERLLLPLMIKKIEEAEPSLPQLSTQYLTIMEVGGAYAHLFFDLLEFLELRTLIITDLDAVEKPGGKACVVHKGTASSNACLKNWFSPDKPLLLKHLVGKSDSEKIKGRMRIAFQHSDKKEGACARTFEDAFIIANAKHFGLSGADAKNLELNAREEAGKLKKSEFALKYAITETDWIAPSYILDGIRWLAAEEISTAATAPSVLKQPSEKSEAGG